jgi:hypothetical protein
MVQAPDEIWRDRSSGTGGSSAQFGGMKRLFRRISHACWHSPQIIRQKAECTVIDHFEIRHFLRAQCCTCKIRLRNST